MPNEITQEQAVEILKWMDAEWEKIEGVFHVYGVDGRAWLSSPDGEVAMMDKLDLLENFDDWNTHRYTLGGQGITRVHAFKPFKINIFVESPTRNTALQLAILEMLEVK